MTAPIHPGGRDRPIRFVIVGAGAAGLLFLLVWAFSAAGLPPFAGSMLAYAIAFAVAYTAQRNWTFGAEQAHGRALPRYFAVQAGSAVFCGLTSHVAVEGFALSPLMMSAATTALASAASYMLSTLWVFPAALRISPADASSIGEAPIYPNEGMAG